MDNILTAIITDFAQQYPQPGQPPQLELTVGTHDPDRDTSKFRLSDAGRCRLMRYWKRQGKAGARDIPGSVALQMQAGNLLHAYIEKAVYDMGCLLAAEETLEDLHRIGHFDMIIQSPVDGAKILYDIKTITNKKAYYMARNGNQTDGQHVAQLVSYALMYPGPLDFLRLAYVTRDTLEISEVEINLSKVESEVQDDWERLIGSWIAECEPDPNPEQWECRYCQYGATCHAAIR